jgi:alkylation response protein AidB-like acyl-CoA dehydrogenase
VIEHRLGAFERISWLIEDWAHRPGQAGRHRGTHGRGARRPGAHRAGQLIAESRIDIDQARLLVYRTAWLIDRYGAQGARAEIAAIKVAAPAMATRVIERAIEVFGAAGVSDDTPLAYFYAWARVLRIVDGPDAVHRRTLAREELRRERPYVG